MLLLCVVFCPSVSAKPGDSCDDPIVLTPEYEETILKAGTKWYIANTFDLPLAISFYPSTLNAAAPELYLDFSCTSGEYDDPILCSLFCSWNSAYISMPYKQIPTISYDEKGNARYKVEFGEFYRDMLLRQGIDYNVPVYVRAVFSCSGVLTMEPDAFSACMDGPKFIHLGDTVQVRAKDKDRHVIVPYVQWQYDSIRYVWQGTQPCTVAVGNNCEFDPTSSGSSILDAGVIQPGDQFKVSSELLMQYVSDQKNYPNEAGMYFAKFYSEAPGVMKIEKIPAPLPAAGATLLRYGTKTDVARNDTAALYAIPSSWVKAMQLSTPTDRIFKMYVGKTPDFYLKDAVASYQFDRAEEGHVLSLLETDLAGLWKNKVEGENYLYIRFECSDNTTVLPTLWTPSDCLTKTKRIQAGKQFSVDARSKAVYGLFYEDWKDGDMTIAWTNTQTACPFYVAGVCDVPNSNTSPVFYAGSVPKKGSALCSKDMIDSWAQHVDVDGYLYIRFYPNAKGNITVTTNAPEETDPQCPTFDSVMTVTAWDSCVWQGATYKKSGRYTKDGNLDPETGCLDTIFTLFLTIHTTSYDAKTLTGCDTVEFGGKAYTESGSCMDTAITSAGNRVITSLSLTVRHSSSSDTTATACGGMEWRGKWYDADGDYSDTLTNAEGCDSIRTLHLTVYEKPEDEEAVQVVWDSLVWNGKTYTQSGDYTIEMKNLDGCKYLYTLHLTVHTTAYDTLSADGCDSIVVDDVKYTRSGIYDRDTLLDAGGNRTIRTLRLTVSHTSYAEAAVTAFDSYLSPQGKTYRESGDYTDTIPNIAGCDSVITTRLTIHTTTVVPVDPMSGCDKIEYEGKVYTKSGDFADTTFTASGDRIIKTFTLTIGHTTYTEDYVYKNGSYTSPLGNTYTESGDYEERTTNVSGCDSIITIHLTIGNAVYDTVYFCRGYNREHEEQVNELLIRYYRPYTYESPDWFDYKEGVFLESKDDAILVDLNRAEANLYNHYTGGMTPIETIAWSVRYVGENVYTPLTVEPAPQWIGLGVMAVQIRFRCGEMYTDALSVMGVDDVQTSSQPLKRIENGQVVIMRGDAVYTPLGVRLR
jgi:hypothetical protein